MSEPDEIYIYIIIYIYISLLDYVRLMEYPQVVYGLYPLGGSSISTSSEAEAELRGLHTWDAVKSLGRSDVPKTKEFDSGSYKVVPPQL